MNHARFCPTILLLLTLGLLGSASRLAADEPAAALKTAEISKADPKDVDAWRKLKFGLFVHWGPVSLKGTEIGWSRGAPRRGLSWKMTPGMVPGDVYDNLYKQFNPTKFNAPQWVQIAKDAGMKYLVFTTKHHDGFCNFDSKLTDYKITSPECPYGRDIVRQLADACHAGNLLWGVYYSQPDWHPPDYFNGPQRPQKYIEYLHGQMRELLTGYGKVSMIFFDGLSGKAKDWDAPRLINMCRELQPGVMINNRAGVPADFDTPEQRIGKMQTDRPWETCMTICNQWAWKPDDEMKSFKQCIQTLVRVVGGDGNLLFNVGPMPDGRIEPRQVERLREMGDWLKKYGETIYDTRGGPFETADWGAATYRGNTIYLHVLDGGKRPVVLPPIARKIVAHKVLTGGAATVEQNDQAIIVTLADDARNDVDAIVELTLDGPAIEAKPFPFHEATRNVPKPRETWPLVKEDMVPMDLKVISDEIVTSDTDPAKKLRKIMVRFNSIKLEGKVWTHPSIIFMPADNSINMTPQRRGKVAIISSPCVPGHPVFDAHVTKYGDPIATRTGYPTMVLANPGEHPDGFEIERDIMVLGRIGQRTGKYYYNMNCQLAVVYVQAMNAMEQILDVRPVKAVLGGHSKRGLSTPVAAAMDSRVASAIIMGNEGICPLDRVTPWLTFHYPFFQDQVHVPVFYLGATNEDGYRMFNVNQNQAMCKVPMTVEMIPNYRHSNFCETQFMDTLMWVSHTFDGRPLSQITDVTHERRGNLDFYRAKIDTKAKIQLVQCWCVYSDNPEWRDLMWYNHIMRREGDRWVTVTGGKTPDAFLVEVGDTWKGIPGYVTSLPQKITDAPLKQRPGKGLPRLWAPTN